jgi:hypothetical protein
MVEVPMISRDSRRLKEAEDLLQTYKWVICNSLLFGQWNCSICQLNAHRLLSTKFDISDWSCTGWKLLIWGEWQMKKR